MPDTVIVLQVVKSACGISVLSGAQRYMKSQKSTFNLLIHAQSFLEAKGREADLFLEAKGGGAESGAGEGGAGEAGEGEGDERGGESGEERGGERGETSIGVEEERHAKKHFWSNLY